MQCQFNFSDTAISLRPYQTEEILARADAIACEYSETFYMWNKFKRRNLANSKPSDKQIAFLKKIAPEISPATISKETASQIISAYVAKKEASKAEPPTSKQLSFLRYNGCCEIPKSKGEATKMIASIMGGNK